MNTSDNYLPDDDDNHEEEDEPAVEEGDDAPSAGAPEVKLSHNERDQNDDELPEEAMLDDEEEVDNQDDGDDGMASVAQIRTEYEQRLAELRLELERERTSTRKELETMQTSYENRIKRQQLESTRNENILIMRLTLKEQELQDCLAQIETLRNGRKPSIHQLESHLLDPALNYVFERMKKEVDRAKLRVEEMQNEMNAWKFSADSITGKQLMAKCRQLHQENEELGKMISSGKIAKLESSLAMHKNYSETLNKSQADIDEVLNEVEENVEGFQNTVYYLQQQLKEAKQKYENVIRLIQTDCQCEGLKNQMELWETES